MKILLHHRRPLIRPIRNLLDTGTSTSPPRQLPPLRALLSHSSTTAHKDSAAAPFPPRNPRWLADIRSRLGQCITFGLDSGGGRAETEQAAEISRCLADEWRGLVAGAEGFVTEDGELGRRFWRERSGGVKPTFAEKVLWGEMDSMVSCHVNNVTYLRYAETSRIHYFQRLMAFVPPEHKQDWAEIMTPRGIGLILKSITVEYLFPLTFPDRLTLAHSLDPSGSKDSAVMRCLVLSHRHQRPAARIREDVPFYDYRRGRKASPPPWLVRVFEEAARTESEFKSFWEGRRLEIEGMVEDLEQKTVKSGRTEDMGGPSL